MFYTCYMLCNCNTIWVKHNRVVLSSQCLSLWWGRCIRVRIHFRVKNGRCLCVCDNSLSLAFSSQVPETDTPSPRWNLRLKNLVSNCASGLWRSQAPVGSSRGSSCRSGDPPYAQVGGGSRRGNRAGTRRCQICKIGHRPNSRSLVLVMWHRCSWCTTRRWAAVPRRSSPSRCLRPSLPRTSCHRCLRRAIPVVIFAVVLIVTNICLSRRVSPASLSGRLHGASLLLQRSCRRSRRHKRSVSTALTYGRST